MTKFQKVAVLVLMLVLPILLWLFLKFFGQNQFDIPLYYPNGLDSLSDCQNNTAPHQVNLSLTGLPGATFNEAALSGRATVVYFLPSDCADTCLLVLEELAKLQKVFNAQSKVQLLAIADRTNKAVLPSLSQRFRAQPDTWKFLTGATPEMQRCQFALPLADIAASETLILVDSERQIRGYYTGTDPDEVDRLTVEMKILLSNSSQSDP